MLSILLTGTVEFEDLMGFSHTAQGMTQWDNTQQAGVKYQFALFLCYTCMCRAFLSVYKHSLGIRFLLHGSNVPRKKQTDSERLHRSMLGATLPRTRPICCSLVSPGLRTSLCEEAGGRESRRWCHQANGRHSTQNGYAPGTREQRWRCCPRRRRARGKAPPAGWRARRGRRSRSRSPLRRGLSSPPPGSHPDPPETWSPPARRKEIRSAPVETVADLLLRHVFCISYLLGQ